MKKKTAIILILVVAIASFAFGAWVFMEDYYEDDAAYIPSSCNVLTFDINGYLATYVPLDTEGYDVTSSDDVLDGLRLVAKTPHVKAVLLSIDSGGGDGVAGEEIANALKALEKPSVAVIRGIGASSAYWAASGADKVFASRISDIGSIGVTASYLDESIKNARDGYTYVELSSTRYKDVGDPSRPLSAEERAIVLDDLKKIHGVFVDDVAVNRNLERDEVAKLANGLTYLGADALQYGLIDEIGDLITATDYISQQIGEEVELCWY